MQSCRIIAIAVLLSAGVLDIAGARAQAVIQRPGEAPVYVNPGLGGGYTIQRPGQSPTYVNPRSGSGYAVQSPGETPAYVNPGADGNATAPIPAPSRGRPN